MLLARYHTLYHPDPRAMAWYDDPDWTAWRLLERAPSRFPGHRPPPQPAAGPRNGANSAVVAEQAATARAHGIDAFLFDVYGDAQGPLREAPLQQGLLGGSGGGADADDGPQPAPITFAVCWQNGPLAAERDRRHEQAPRRLSPGCADAGTFVELTDHLLKSYCLQPDYLRVGPAATPFVSIADPGALITACGGVEATAAALSDWRQRARALGLPGLHLDLIAWGAISLPGERFPRDAGPVLDHLGIDSVSLGHWTQACPFTDWPTVDYAAMRDAYLAWWQTQRSELSVPVLPNLSLGWDPSPHAALEEEWYPDAWPFTPVLTGNEPAVLQETAQRFAFLLEELPEELRLCTLSSWNDWTQGSQLEADEASGSARLEAIAAGFAAW